MRIGIGIGLLLGRGAGGGGVVVPTLGILAANRTQLPTNTFAATAPFTSRRSHWSHPSGAISNLKFVDIGWGYPSANSNEANLGTGTRTIKKYIEYPAGTFTQVTWSAAGTVNIAPGGQVVSDAINITIPAGTQFWERTVDTVSATIPIMEMPAAHDVLGLPDGNVQGSDLGNSGTVPQGTTTASVGSSAILGDVNATGAISFIAYGDSLLFGTGDVSSVGSLGQSGWVRRGLSQPCVAIGRSGQTATAIAALTTKLAAFLAAIKFSHVINQIGLNDLAAASRTQAQLLADYQTLFALTSGKTIYQCTIGPRTDTTDAWATLTNQTARADGTWSLLTSVNTAIRAGLANVTGLIEWADAAMSARNSGKWKAPPIWTTDGTHPNSLASAAIPAVAYNGLFGVPLDTTAATITSSASPSVNENSAFSLSLTANEYIVTWAIVGGADQALFGLSGNTLTMTAKDYEIPTDANTDNVYVVQVRATDASGNITNQTINVTVADVVEGGYTFTNAEAATAVAAMTVQPNNTRKAAYDNLFGALKAGALGGVNLLTVMDGLWVFAAADAQSALLNLLNPGVSTAFEVNTPTFTTDVGYNGNGTSSYVNLNYNPTTYPSAKFLQNSAHFGVWSNAPAQNAASIGGWFDGTDGVTVLPRSATDTAAWRVNQALATQTAASAITTGAGAFTADRSGASATKLTQNGVNLAASTNANQASTALNNATLKVGVISASSFTAAQFSAAWVGGNLGSDNVHLDLYNALRTYMTAVGVP